MKIVILDGYTLNPGDLSWDEMNKLGDVTVYDITQYVDITDRIGDAEIVITNKTPIDKTVLDTCNNIKYIGVLATGYNVVDTEYAKTKNIPVTNIPTYGTAAVAQYVAALLLEICHHIGYHDKTVKEGKWQKSDHFCYWDYPLIELDNKTMGLIGFGKIGRQTAKVAQGLGMNILAYDSYIDESLETNTLKYTDLDTLLQESDVISLHCPLFPSTEGIINKDNINKMKDGVIIINTSRGPLIVEEDLKIALDSGKVFAAAVDVVSTEPITSDNPLLSCDNCIITPHIAWAPKEARSRLLNIAVDNLKSFIEGKTKNVVNEA